MLLNKSHIKNVQIEFNKIRSKDELVLLLNHVQTYLFKDHFPLITNYNFSKFSNINFILNKNNSDYELTTDVEGNSCLSPKAYKNKSPQRYHAFKISKKSGDKRLIHAPVNELKVILKSLNYILECIYQPHKAATGFVLNKSIVDNAKIHSGSNYVFNLDLKDFFHSFDVQRIKRGFMKAPFNLNGDREPLAFYLASLCCHEINVNDEVKMLLPQGSPTSPTISNILCKTLDHRLTGLANRFGVRYSRYADDITFSSMHSVFHKSEFLAELKRIIEVNQELIINPKKTRLQKGCHKQEVTGLIVNEKINVKKHYVKEIRMWLYYWEKYGFYRADNIFRRDYIRKKRHTKKTKPDISKVLGGKLQFLKMVKGEDDSTYKTLKRRYNNLLTSRLKTTEIIRIWENEGIEKAMEKYYGKGKLYTPVDKIKL